MIGIYIDTPAFDEVTMDQASTFTDKLSTVGGTFGLLTGFSLISGVEIFFFLAKFLLGFLTRRKKIQEHLQDITNFWKAKTSEQSIEVESFNEKSVEKKKKNLEEKILSIEKIMDRLQSELESMHMREKQAEFGDSNAGDFFDAIFKNKIAPTNTEEDNQDETTP